MPILILSQAAFSELVLNMYQTEGRFILSKGNNIFVVTVKITSRLYAPQQDQIIWGILFTVCLLVWLYLSARNNRAFKF